MNHPTFTWEVSLLKLEDNNTSYYKVTRSMYLLGISETKLFTSKQKAKQQFNTWLE
tara:strand:- start:138 stop:305 length:168 start_codon:yes stop_codon:yes gene_type:complete